MANQIKVKWPAQNIYEDETHRLVTDEQIARWDDGIKIKTIRTTEDSFNDLIEPGFYRVSGDIKQTSPSSWPCNPRILVGGFVITKDSVNDDENNNVPLAVTQIFYDIYFNKYMRVGVPSVNSTPIDDPDNEYYISYYGSTDVIDWGDWVKVEYSLGEDYDAPEGITGDKETYYLETIYNGPPPS